MKRSDVEAWLRAATSGKGTMGSVHEDLFIMPQEELAQLCLELLALMPEDRRSGKGRREYDGECPLGVHPVSDHDRRRNSHCDRRKQS